MFSVYETETLLTNIRYEFDKIHNSYERLKFSTLVPCNCKTCLGKQQPHFYTLTELLERKELNKQTIECKMPPYFDVEVASLIDDKAPEPNRRKNSKKNIRNQVFISYSHQDKKWLDELQKHLKPFDINHLISVWTDTKIKPGEEWYQEIQKALVTAKVAILLVSPNFLASDFINEEELPQLLDKAEKNGLTIFWIPISDSAYRETAIAKYQAAHTPDVPLDDLSQAGRNKALVKICERLKEALIS